MKRESNWQMPLGASILLWIGVGSPVIAQAPAPARVPTPAPWPELGVTEYSEPPTPVSRCNCGNRRGLSRWAHHKSECKRNLQRKLVGFPEEFNELPLGSAVQANFKVEVGNGEAARMTFYQYDFVDRSSVLNVRGQDKILEIAAFLPVNFAPIIIERIPTNPRLAEARRQAVLSALAAQPFPVPPERVVIGRPVPTGRSGGESLIIDAGRLSGVAAGPSGSMGGSGGASGPSGFDSSGLSGMAQSGPR